MIYVCIPCRDEGSTIGLVLWKIRQAFAGIGREYQILVADDGSTDQTAEVLESYVRALPLTVARHPEPRGAARAAAHLLALALQRSDRPRRDAALVLHADFRHAPETLPELVRRIESGADLVVAEGTLEGEPSRAARLLRRFAPLLLRGKVELPGVRDTVSGCFAVRLGTVRAAFRDQVGDWLATTGWAAQAELLGRLAVPARRVLTLPVTERVDRRGRASRVTPWHEAKALWKARALLAIPAAGSRARQEDPDEPSPSLPEPQRRRRRSRRPRRKSTGRTD